jgi:hypothetical protein
MSYNKQSLQRHINSLYRKKIHTVNVTRTYHYMITRACGLTSTFLDSNITNITSNHLDPTSLS